MDSSDDDDSVTFSKKSRFDSVTSDDSTSPSANCSVDRESGQESSSDSLHTIEDDDSEYEGGPFSYTDPLLMSSVILSVLGKNWEKLKESVEQGKELNLTLNDGNTALHYAISYGYIDMLKYLLEQPGIRTDVINYEGYGLMAWAVKNFECQTLEIISILLEAGCSVNNEDDRVSTLIEVIASQRISIKKKNQIALQLLEANVDINKRDIYKQSALHISIILFANSQGYVSNQEHYLNLFYMLLYYNADVLTVDCNYESPYTFAKTNCTNPEIADALFDYIADFNYAEECRLGDCGYYTMLMCSIELGCDKVFTIIERGGDVNAYGHKCDIEFCEVAVKTCLSLACQTDPAVFQIIWDNCDMNLLFEVQPDFIQIFVEKCIFSAPTFLNYFYKLLKYEKAVVIFRDLYIYNLIFKQMVDKMHSFKLDRNERMKIIFSLLCINTHCLDYELLVKIYARFGFDEELEAFLKVCGTLVRANIMLTPMHQCVGLIFRPQVTRRWYNPHKIHPRNFRKGIKRTLVQLSRDVIREHLQPAILANDCINFKYYVNLLKSNIPNYLIDIITLKKELYPHENKF